MGNSSSTTTTSSTSGTYNLRDFNNLRNTLGNCDNLEIENKLDSLEGSNIKYTPECQENVNTFFYLEEDNTTEDNTTEDNTTEDNTKEDNTTEDNTTEDNTTEDNTTEDNTTEENTTEDNTTEDNTKENNTSGYLNNLLGQLNNYIVSNFLLNKDNDDLSVLKELDGVTLLNCEETELKGDRDQALKLAEEYSLGGESSSIYNINCIYEMPENTIGFYNRSLGASLDDCYLGYSNGNNSYQVYSPSGNPEIHRTYRLRWLVYDNGDSVSVLLDDISGVVLDDDGNIVELGNNYFGNLIDAYKSLEETNIREMNSYVNKFNSIKDELLSGNDIMAIVGGEETGNLISLGNFLNNLDL